MLQTAHALPALSIRSPLRTGELELGLDRGLDFEGPRSATAHPVSLRDPAGSSLVPRPRPAFRRYLYGKAGRGLGMRRD